MAEPITHLEKTIAGEVTPVTHLEHVIAEYGGGNVYDSLEAGVNITIEETSDGKAKISASGEVSSEDTVARAEIAEMKDGTTLDSFGDVETALADKADTDNVYSKSAVDTALSDKADKSTTYTKTEVDTALSAKANSADVYSKSDIDTAMGAKADKSTTYTKTEVDTALGGKVDKVQGKGLSTEDYSTSDKTKLGALAEIKSVGTGLSLNSSTGELTATGGGGAVSGVKGSEETNYRTGNVSISAANVGAIPTTEKGANNGVAALDSNGKIAAETLKAGALASGMTATTQAISDDSTKLATTAYVHDVVDALPSPMVFKGTLGSTGATISALPIDGSAAVGDTYKVVTNGTYVVEIDGSETYTQDAKRGDIFICRIKETSSNTWTYIPSGDEPSGTVTNVAVANSGGLTVNGSPITSSGTITVGHSNSVTAKTSSSLKKFTYDAYGHVTGSSELSTAESNALASGIDSIKVAQIETNKNNILIEDITSTYTIETGYTLSAYSKVYKQGKHVFGLLSIKIDTGTIPTSQTAIATATNKPAVSYVTGCFCGTSEWDISTTGYVFINPSTGAILARDTADPTTNTTFNIQVDYVIS